MNKLEEMAAKFKERYANDEKMQELIAQLKESAETKQKAKTINNENLLEKIRASLVKKEENT